MKIARNTRDLIVDVVVVVVVVIAIVFIETWWYLNWFQFGWMDWNFFVFFFGKLAALQRSEIFVELRKILEKMLYKIIVHW